MSKRRHRHEKDRAATARFPQGAYVALAQEAENRGTTIAAIIRMAWASYQEKTEVDLQFRKLESRIVKQMFEVCSATLGLSEAERKAAIKEFKKQTNRRGE